MKLMRGYRFRREALRMLKTFLVVWIAAFLFEALMDWGKGELPARPFLALVASACLFMLVAAVLFVIDWVIQARERKQKTYPEPLENGPRPR